MIVFGCVRYSNILKQLTPTYVTGAISGYMSREYIRGNAYFYQNSAQDGGGEKISTYCCRWDYAYSTIMAARVEADIFGRIERRMLSRRSSFSFSWITVRRLLIFSIYKAIDTPQVECSREHNSYPGSISCWHNVVRHFKTAPNYRSNSPQ